LIPEVHEYIENFSFINKILFLTFFTLMWMFILKILDIFLPNHSHHHGEKHLEKENFKHIWIIASIALILHNIIEWIALYVAWSTDEKTAIMLLLWIWLHNIPLWFVIASTFYQTIKSKFIVIMISLVVWLASFLWWLIVYFNDISGIVIWWIMSLTMWMLLYIALFELLPKMLCSDHKKATLMGVKVWVLILFVSALI
jgi:zinc transporter ZupT